MKVSDLEWRPRPPGYKNAFIARFSPIIHGRTCQGVIYHRRAGHYRVVLSYFSSMGKEHKIVDADDLCLLEVQALLITYGGNDASERS